MEVGEFNLYKIKMNLDLLHTREDRLKFLYETKKNLRKVIRCFASNKLIGLRNYARDDIILEDNCPELMQFLKKIIMKYCVNPRDTRYPGEDTLRREILSEIRQYERFDMLIEMEIEQVMQDTVKKEDYSSI